MLTLPSKLPGNLHEENKLNMDQTIQPCYEGNLTLNKSLCWLQLIKQAVSVLTDTTLERSKLGRWCEEWLGKIMWGTWCRHAHKRMRAEICTLGCSHGLPEWQKLHSTTLNTDFQVLQYCAAHLQDLYVTSTSDVWHVLYICHYLRQGGTWQPAFFTFLDPWSSKDQRTSSNPNTLFTKQPAMIYNPVSAHNISAGFCWTSSI